MPIFYSLNQFFKRPENAFKCLKEISDLELNRRLKNNEKIGKLGVRIKQEVKDGLPRFYFKKDNEELFLNLEELEEHFFNSFFITEYYYEGEEDFAMPDSMDHWGLRLSNNFYLAFKDQDTLEKMRREDSYKHVLATFIPESSKPTTPTTSATPTEEKKLTTSQHNNRPNGKKTKSDATSKHQQQDNAKSLTETQKMPKKLDKLKKELETQLEKKRDSFKNFWIGEKNFGMYVRKENFLSGKERTEYYYFMNSEGIQGHVSAKELLEQFQASQPPETKKRSPHSSDRTDSSPSGPKPTSASSTIMSSSASVSAPPSHSTTLSSSSSPHTIDNSQAKRAAEREALRQRLEAQLKGSLDSQENFYIGKKNYGIYDTKVTAVGVEYYIFRAPNDGRQQSCRVTKLLEEFQKHPEPSQDDDDAIVHLPPTGPGEIKDGIRPLSQKRENKLDIDSQTADEAVNLPHQREGKWSCLKKNNLFFPAKRIAVTTAGVAVTTGVAYTASVAAVHLLFPSEGNKEYLAGINEDFSNLMLTTVGEINAGVMLGIGYVAIGLLACCLYHYCQHRPADAADRQPRALPQNPPAAPR